jgi:hypothetical protein
MAATALVNGRNPPSIAIRPLLANVSKAVMSNPIVTDTFGLLTHHYHQKAGCISRGDNPVKTMAAYRGSSFACFDY